MKTRRKGWRKNKKLERARNSDRRAFDMQARDAMDRAMGIIRSKKAGDT